MTRFSLGIGTLLALAACPPRPLSFGARGQITEPSELLAALEARSNKLLRLESEARVSGSSARGSAATGGLVAAERPASLKLELDDFFGNPAALLTTDGVSLGIFTAQDHLYREGAATPGHLAQLVPIEIPLREAVDLLFGDPRPLGGTPKSFFVDRHRRSYALLFEADDRRQRIDLDTETLLPIHVQLEGRFVYEAAFSDPEGDSVLRIPGKIEIVTPTGSVSVSYRGPTVNPKLKDGFFRPVAPAGAKRLPLED